VLVPELVASDELIRAVSVAARSHLLTPTLGPTLSREVQAQAEDIERAQRQADQERSAEQARDAEVVHERQGRESEARRESARSVERL
jgi:hypothetical protein